MGNSISPLKQNGSKKQLLDITNFTKYFPTLNRSGAFVEPFCGTGAVFFNYAKQRKMVTGVIFNDKNENIQRFFMTVYNHREEFERRINGIWYGLQKYVKPMDEIDEVIIWFLDSLKPPMNLKKPNIIMKDYTELCDILNQNSVMFTSEDWQKSLNFPTRNRGDRCIVYCDPPYDGTEGYKSEFDLDEFAAAIMEKFITCPNIWVFVSLNDTERVRALFNGWYFLKIFAYKKHNLRKDRIEVLISNKPFKDFTIKGNLGLYYKDKESKEGYYEFD